MANLWEPSLVRVTDDNGAPVSGAKLHFEATGTTTPATFYLDADGLVPGTNPLVADSAGMFAPGFVDGGTTYRIRCTNSTGSETFYDVDPVIVGGGGGSGTYTDENARDAIGIALRVTGGLTLAINDGADTITIGVDATDPNTIKLTESFIVACSDEATALTTGTAKVTLRIPYSFTVTAVRASLTTAQTSGSIFTVDINEGGTSILSTKLTIDNTEKTSTTAATAAVISDASLADDAEITFDIDQVGDGTAKGLKVVLIGHRT